MVRTKAVLAAVTLGLALATHGATRAAAAQEGGLEPARVQAAVEEGLPEALALYRELLRYPNNAHDPDLLARQSAWLAERFEALGFEITSLPTAGLPVLLAERRHPGAERTVLVYLQSDGQPVDRSAWSQPDPYGPVVKRRTGPSWEVVPWEEVEAAARSLARAAGRELTPDDGAADGLDPAQARSEARMRAVGLDPEWRIFARSASDSKGPVAQFLAAVAMADALGVAPDFHLKVIVDTEEELGSPHLPDAVRRHREALAADMLVIFDGPPHASGLPTLKFGARGIATLTLTTYGPRVPQHSGHYGNYAPNPGFRLARILAGMKDEHGRVTLPGWYDGISLDPGTKRILAEVPDDEEWIRQRLGIGARDSVGDNLQEAVQYPSLNIRGLSSGWVGDQARTIVPATATAEIDIRLVRESDPERLLGLVREHVEGLGYLVLDRPPTDEERLAHPRIVTFEAEVSYAAFRTAFDSEPGLWLARAYRRLYGHDPIRIRTSGGSIPISPFVETLDLPAVSVPTVNPDNNQHSPDENLRLGSFVEGLRVVLTILGEPLGAAGEKRP